MVSFIYVRSAILAVIVQCSCFGQRVTDLSSLQILLVYVSIRNWIRLERSERLKFIDLLDEVRSLGFLEFFELKMF